MQLVYQKLVYQIFEATVLNARTLARKTFTAAAAP
jgi:hypothetical protein